ncbi:MAG TPA: NAD(P)-dependent oxidoreductase [Stellaceae bacterium]|nr:NAD(P)-dependent oxidoreductase [Stellaceae bacterium]
MDIGLIGIGRMGSAMGERLIDLDRRLTVWNRTPDNAKRLLERGATWAPSPAAVARASELTLTVLTDAKAIDAVYDGPEGLLSGDVVGKLFVDMSTVAPETIRALAARVHAKKAGLVECPVGGTVGPAREGKLVGMAGGAAIDFARARPVLEQLCRRVDLLGPSGTGSAMKLAVNLPLAVYWEALGEALSLVRDADIPPEKMLEILADSSGGTNALKNRASKLAAALKGGPKPEVGFDIDGMRKDLRTMLVVGSAMGLELPVTAKTLDCYESAAQAGWGNRDASNLVVHRLEKARPARQ